LLGAGYDILTMQELLGHKDVRTTMIYTHVFNGGGQVSAARLTRCRAAYTVCPISMQRGGSKELIRAPARCFGHPDTCTRRCYAGTRELRRSIWADWIRFVSFITVDV
jgi:hypothetical protein